MASDRLIAVIDDEEAVLISLESFLRSYGYAVASYTAPEAFLASIENVQPRLIITDYNMYPGMDGIELSKRVRQTFPRVPIFMISAYWDDKTRQMANDARISIKLNKPWLPDDLLSGIERVFGSSS